MKERNNNNNTDSLKCSMVRRNLETKENFKAVVFAFEV